MPQHDLIDTFSDNYFQARTRFVDLAKRCGARCVALPIKATGPNNEPLSIDIAVLGSDTPRRALLHSSGLHGAEGFIGSAVQLGLLQTPPTVAAETAVVLVHVLNPFGMAWLRRANESNVDLNRNFFDPGETPPTAEAYARLDGLLNPQSPPRSDAFFLRAGLAVLRNGYAAVKQAVAGGQYEFERGLFYGGRTREQGPTRYRNWLVENLPDVERVVAIDVHSGLGPWAKATTILQYRRGALSDGFYQRADIANMLSESKATSVYEIRGGIESMLSTVFRNAKTDLFLQEFGTYGPLRVLHALREENRLHHFGAATDLQHPAKRRFKETFCPANERWRRATVQQGVEFVSTVLQDKQW